MKTCGIYKIINIKNGKFYIGSSSNIEKRIRRHIKDLYKNRHHSVYLQRSFNKHKIESFLWTIIQKTSPDELRKIEQLYLDNIDYKNCYNISSCASGGNLTKNHPNKKEIDKAAADRLAYYRKIYPKPDIKGCKNPNWNKRWSEEKRINASKRIKERWKNPSKAMLENCGKKPITEENRKKLSDLAKSRTGVKNPFYGRRHSEEFKKIRSEKQKGIIPPNAANISIKGVKYRSYQEASKILGICWGTIRWRCLSKNEKFNDWKLEVNPHPSIKGELAI